MLAREGERILPIMQHLFIRKGEGSVSLEYFLIFPDCKSEFW